ncbi:hypothetical protein ACEN2T_17925 [Pseudomonas sp. W22_MBD1_FP4]|uniref:hypothetical protein n=1 Tax=Pseudomonas sp. W22_MBD1_FP4 TaxID=3240272 RepID=UPI003F9BC030
MAVIQQINETSYALDARGSRMVLEQIHSGWRMKTRNAATRVWGLGGESWKEFRSLAEVEAKYKSWKGIAALIGTTVGKPA